MGANNTTPHHKKSTHKKKGHSRKSDPIPRFTHDPSEPLATHYLLDENHVLGKGNFSIVYLGEHLESHTRVAIKKIVKLGVKNKPEMLKNEVDILKKLEHPYIIKLYDIFETETELYLVMELVTGGELFDRIVEREQYSESDAKAVMRQLLSAIKYFHELGVVHRDLKPENLLLENERDDTNIKVTDFGLSRIFLERDAPEMMKTACGTPGYVAPEVLDCKGYDKEVDMWSAGVILYILLCGYPPFFSETEPELFELIMKVKYEFHPKYWGHISDDAKDLISRLLLKDPKKRLTAVQALEHPWFKGEKENSRSPMHPEMRESLKKHNSDRKSKLQLNNPY